MTTSTSTTTTAAATTISTTTATATTIPIATTLGAVDGPSLHNVDVAKFHAVYFCCGLLWKTRQVDCTVDKITSQVAVTYRRRCKVYLYFSVGSI